MLARLKLRIGAILMIAGGIVACVGEILLITNGSPANAYWYPAIGAILLGLLVMLFGVNMFAQQSESVGCLGLIGIGLLFIGGLILVIGTIVIDAVVLPILLGIAQFIDHIPVIGKVLQISKSSGTKIVNKFLSDLHLPPISTITIYGHLLLSSAPLVLGCLVLGLALWRAPNFPRFAGFVLVVVALVNIVMEPLTFLPLLGYTIPIISPVASSLGAIASVLCFATSGLLFLSLSWLGFSILFPHLANIRFRLPRIHLRLYWPFRPLTLPWLVNKESLG